ncbi:DUF3592 domain-containing protein [Nocardia sp. NBC_00565]|uniref:DUF3592 domain-containing protein n=1 Tax=Nocardia sp. NBC_00565 TaxID=2975993 RepID=UPI002E800B67|nr:DUF3592 domain-containing protein [Nocardia sp. NBC_00565]WUC01996.1 DUF3592 domain-containing protein [Nocardia sp. NBC_00565]
MDLVTTTPRTFHAVRGALIAGAIGIAIVSAAVVWAVLSMRGLEGTARTDGTVLFAGRGDGRVVEFVVDGKRYTTTTATESVLHTYSTGARVPVAYDPADPADAQVADLHSTYGGPLFAGGFGVLIIAAAVVGYVYGRRKMKLREWLDRQGREIWVPAEHTRVRVTHHDSDSNRPSVFVLQGCWVDPITRRTFTAESDMLREDPSELVSFRGRVRVLYDPADPTRNRIDFDQKPQVRQF